jgi:flavodoxin
LEAVAVRRGLKKEKLMKTLVVFYSRSGVTRKACQELGRVLNADLEELVDKIDRSGMVGWLKGGHDSTFQKSTPIEPVKSDPAQYDLIVLATPVWAFTMTPAMRAYLELNKGKFKRVAFVATMGGSGDQRTYRHMQELIGIAPSATLTLIDKRVRAGQVSDEIAVFASALRGETA